MFPRRFPCTQRSMRQGTSEPSGNGAAPPTTPTSPSSRVTSPAANRVTSPASARRRVYGGYGITYCVLVLLLGACVLAPPGADALYTPPSQCSFETVKINGLKYQHVNCSYAQPALTAFPVDGKNGDDVLKLDLSHNNIGSLLATDLDWFPNITELNLANNPLTNIDDDAFIRLTSLLTLNLAANQLTSLPQEIFTDTNIQTLNLSTCAYMDVTANLASSQNIMILDLSYNLLSTFPDTLFSNMPYLREVYINNNHLTEIGPNVFAQSGILTIDLSYNSLTSVTKQIFKSDSLLSLDLSHNSISSLSNQFLRSASLISLDLSYNSIKSLSDTQFKDASSIENLDVSHNLIADLNIDAFDDCVNLNVVDLSYNQITALDPNLFHYMTMLSELDLSHNQLTSLDVSIFDKAVNMTTLNLAHNQLTVLTSGIFDYNPRLTSINLSNNSFTGLSTTLFDGLNSFAVDLSLNNFTCSCALRNHLYVIYYHENKTLLSEELVKCMDSSSGDLVVFLDWDDTSCSGNLMDSCSAVNECRVRNSLCTGSPGNPGTCVCQSNYYDNNGDTVIAGQCKLMVILDYPCEMNASCSTDNAYCLQGNCQCKPDFYDTSHVFLGGDCEPKKELGGPCTRDDMCKPNNAHCNTGVSLCECVSTHYDSNTNSVENGTCIPKIPLYNTCSATYQCEPDHSECSGAQCVCTDGYYDFGNSGECRAPDEFYSCYQYNTQDQFQVDFQSADDSFQTDSACAQHCFTLDTRYYLIYATTSSSSVCLCGIHNTVGTCCPHVNTVCNGLNYIGDLAKYVTAETNVTYIPERVVGAPYTYTASTELEFIDQFSWSFGDGATELTSGRTSSVQHTYVIPGQWEMTVSACHSGSGVCDAVSIDVHVQVQAANLTAWITGVSDVALSASLEGIIYSTFTSGYDFQYAWSKNDSQGVVTRKQGCASPWIQVRDKCVREVTMAADYTTAVTGCQSLSGSLLEIDYVEEIPDIIAGLGATASSGSLLMNAQRLALIWQWGSGSGSRAPFALDDLALGDCAAIDPSTEQPVVVSCAASLNYVCMTAPVDCPLGGTLTSERYCLVLVSDQSASPPTLGWSQADDYCQTNFNGGRLVKIETAAHQALVDNLLSSSSSTSAWMGLHDSTTEGYYSWSDSKPYDFHHPGGSVYQPTITANEHDCFVTEVGAWQSQDCSLSKDFICQYSWNVQSLSVEPSVVGLADLQVPVGTSWQQVVATDTFDSPDTDKDIWLFPGMRVTKNATKVRWWGVHGVLGTSDSFDIALQVYRPSCSDNLLPPECGGTWASTCSSSSPTCSSLTCPSGQYYCAISHICKSLNEPCTCVSEASVPKVANLCANDGTIPTYTLVGQTQITVAIPNEFILKIPAGDLTSQEGDVLGIQFEPGKNPIQCTDEPTNPGQEKVLKVSNTAWMARTLGTFPSAGVTKEDVTCKFHAVLTEDVIENFTGPHAYSPNVGSYDLSLSIIGYDTKTLTVNLEEAISGASLVSPAVALAPAHTDTSYGTVYTSLNQNYNITIKVLRGTNKQSLWSYEPAQYVSFTDTCRPDVLASFPTECDASLGWTDTPYTTFSRTMSATGTSTVTVTLSNSVSNDEKTIVVQTEENIDATTIGLLNTPYTADTVAKGTSVSFQTTMGAGTAVDYVYSVDSTQVAAPSNAILSHTFNTIGSATVSVATSNIVSTGSASTTVSVKQAAEFTSCQFNGAPYIFAVNVQATLEIQCSVQLNAEVKATWNFTEQQTDSTTAVTTTTDPVMTMSHAVTFTAITTTTGIVVSASIEDPFEMVTIHATIDVYNPVTAAELHISSQHVNSNVNVVFTPSVPALPGNYSTVSFTITYGDSSASELVTNGNTFTHAYAAPGNYTVQLEATNGPTTATTTSYVTVYNDVSGCSVTYDGPSKVSTVTTFTAAESAGTYLSYTFTSASQFDQSQDSQTFTHTFTTTGEYNVTVNCSNALSSEVASVTAIILGATEIRINDILVNINVLSSCLEKDVSYQFQPEVVFYDEASLTYDWDMGDFDTTIAGSATKDKIYTSAENFTVSVTANYAPESATQTQTKAICVQERISSPVINIQDPVGLPASGTVDVMVNVSVGSGSSMSTQWTTTADVVGDTTSSVLTIRLTAEGSYSIDVTLSNSINLVTASVMFSVVAEISGLQLACSNCTSRAGNMYVTKDAPYTYTATSATGSQPTYTWDFGDTTTGTGASVSHTFNALGSYTIQLTAQNSVALSVVTNVTVYVEEQLLGVTLRHVSTTLPNRDAATSEPVMDIDKTATFGAVASPSGMEGSLQFEWDFDTSDISLLPLQTNNIAVASVNYTTTGFKTCQVNVTNTLGSMVSQLLQFYVIEKINEPEIQVHMGPDLLSRTTSYKVTRETYTVTVTSPHIVANTVNYLIRLKHSSGSLYTSGNKASSTFDLTSILYENYTLTVILENMPAYVASIYELEVIHYVSGVTVVEVGGENGNVTRGDTYQLQASIVQGKYLEYRWSYSSAPNGENFTGVDNLETAAFVPGHIGTYTVTLEVSNPVTAWIVVNYMFKVLEGVSGVQIDVTLPFTDAVPVRSPPDSFTFTATVAQGTDLHYDWNAFEGSSLVSSGTSQTFNVTFSVQTVYNITLTVFNDASSQLVYREIYSLNEVPSFTLDITGANYESSINKYVTQTTTSLSFVSNISNINYISFAWFVDSSPVGSGQSLTHVISAAGTYNIKLEASNNISSGQHEVTVVGQDPVTGLSVANCGGIYQVDAVISMNVTYTTGTDLTLDWTGRGLSSSTGSQVDATYSVTGSFTVDLTASNYVSTETQSCPFVIQGVIENLAIEDPLFKFANFPINFTAMGTNLDNHVSYSWTISGGGTTDIQSTTDPTLLYTFASAGTYTVTVEARNDVSLATADITVVIEVLKCQTPVLAVDGNAQRNTEAGRVIDLAVTIDTNGCAYYVLNILWTVYSVPSSCADPLTTQYPLSNNILRTSAQLHLPAATLQNGKYCAVFQGEYGSTPVTESKTFELTIGESDLVAQISGGAAVSVNEGSELMLDASGSYDPDGVASSISYSWDCTPTTVTASSMATCIEVKAISGSSATLTSGITLIVGEEYTVHVTVSYAGRISATAEQKITVTISGTPVLSISCLSALVNKNSHVSSSKFTSFEGTCVSGCSTSSTYQWTVTLTATQATANIDTARTTTGFDSKNLVLKPNALDSQYGYTFTMSATENGVTGSASYELSASTNPNSGTVTVSTAAVVPMLDRVTVVANNWVEVDPKSEIYLRIVAESSTSTDQYLLYFGTGKSVQVYVAPFSAMANIQVKVHVENYKQGQTYASSATVTFAQPTLTTPQTNNVDFIRDQLRSILVVIANKNNPSLQLQYIIAAALFLNDQSATGTGMLADRMAIRQLLAEAVRGLPVVSMSAKQQKASAIAYISKYPAELSLTCLEILSVEIGGLISEYQTTAQQGSDQNEYDPSKLLEAANNQLMALQQDTLVTISNAAMETIFGSMSQYQLVISIVYTDTSYASDAAARQSLATIGKAHSKKLVALQLLTMVEGESAISFHQSDGTSYTGQLVDNNSQAQTYSADGVYVEVQSGVLSHASYVGPTALHVSSFNRNNVLNFTPGQGTTVNSRTAEVSFLDRTGQDIVVQNLPQDKYISILMFKQDALSWPVTSSDFTTSSSYYPRQYVDYKSFTIISGKTYTFEVNKPIDAGTSVAIQLLPLEGELTATLKLNQQPYGSSKTITQTMVQNEQHSHHDFTYFIGAELLTINSNAFTIELIGNMNMELNISQIQFTCMYYDEISETWESSGCEATSSCIMTVSHCLCNHMTAYGSSMLVSLADINFSDLTEVDIISNPVAIITCSVVLFVYIVAVIVCRRNDLLDIKRISNIPLCGKDGSFKYEVTTVTGRLPGAGTSAHVGVRLVGEYGKTGRQHISKDSAFQRNCSDTFVIAYDVNLGELQKIYVWHDNSGLAPSWYLSHIIVHDLQTFEKYYFFCHAWLSLEQEKGAIQCELKVAGPKEMSRFGYRFKTAMFNSLADKHLWLSLMNRPARSRFTRVQRATCCVTLLFTFIGVSAIWYGLLKKDNSEIGWGTFGWEEMVLAMVTNIMMFPISFGLIFLFKKSRSKANMFEHLQKPQTAESIEIDNMCDNSQGGSFESRNTGGLVVPYDIERESTIDSVPQAATTLHRSRVLKSQRERELTNDSLNTPSTSTTRPRVAMTTASAKSPLWNQENIMKWPEAMQYNDADSRPSTSSTIGPSGRPAPSKAGTKTPAPSAFKKGKTLKSKDAQQQLLDELEDLENELRENEAKSVRSSGSKRSAASSRKASLRKASWGSLEDILHSDDESVAESSRKASGGKRGSTTSTGAGKKFNPRADPRINGNSSRWPKSRESVASTSQTVTFEEPVSHGITSGLRPGYYSEMTMESRDMIISRAQSSGAQRDRCSLPPWCVYVAYVLCFLLSVFSVIVVILYCFKFGTDESTEWVLAVILSLVLSFLIIEPLKALLIAVFIVASHKSVEEDEDDDNINIEPTFDNSNEKLKDVKFKPVSGFALLQAKEEGRKIHRMNVMLRQLIAYVFYLWVLLVVCYINFSQDTYLLNKYVNTSFVQTTTPNTYVNFDNISSIDKFWDWSENVLAESLHLQDTSTDEEHGFLLGVARWRLIRSLPETCVANNAAAKLGASSLTQRTCYGENGFEEDIASYGEKWNDSSYNKSWRYSSSSQLGGSHKVGHVDTYGGGGYTQELGSTHAETLTIIHDLKYKGFIDLRTRALVIEFAMYSPGTDMTAMVALLVEFPLTGGALTSSEIQSQRLLWFMENRVDPLMVMECILLLVVVYSLVHLTLQIRERRKAYFHDVWNWYEMLTTLMTVVSIGMYVGCVVEATNTFNDYLDNQAGFTNFERVAYVHVGMRYLHAWLLFLLMYKVVKQLRFIKFMHVYEKTLSAAVGHLLGTGLIYGILLLVYAQLGHLMYGRIVAGFETYWHTISTLVVMIRGTFDFWPLLDHHPVFSHFFVYSYYAFTYGIAVALVLSVLTSTYKMVRSQMTYKATLEMQDYEMIDFMLKRFKLWAGLKKPKPAFRQVHFPGLPSISSRSTSSYSSRTTSSVQSSGSMGMGPEFSQTQLNSMLVRLAPTWQAVLKRFDKIEALEKEEESLVKKAENTMKDLNLRCRINEFERQHKEILNWQKPGTSGASGGAESSSKQRQSVAKRPPNRDNQSDRKAPATVTGATSRQSVTPPAKEDKVAAQQGKRPLSDQGARGEQETSGRSSTTREKVHKFLQSVKPSKPAWNK